MPTSISPSGSSNVGTPAVGTVHGPEADAHAARAIVGEPGGRRDVGERRALVGPRAGGLEDDDVAGDAAAPAAIARRGADETSSVTSTVSDAMPRSARSSAAMSKFMTSPP